MVKTDFFFRTDASEGGGRLVALGRKMCRKICKKMCRKMCSSVTSLLSGKTTMDQTFRTEASEGGLMD